MFIYNAPITIYPQCSPLIFSYKYLTLDCNKHSVLHESEYFFSLLPLWTLMISHKYVCQINIHVLQNVSSNESFFKLTFMASYFRNYLFSYVVFLLCIFLNLWFWLKYLQHFIFLFTSLCIHLDILFISYLYSFKQLQFKFSFIIMSSIFSLILTLSLSPLTVSPPCGQYGHMFVNFRKQSRLVSREDRVYIFRYYL